MKIAKVSNYRPISLLTAFSKVIERIDYNKIMTFFKTYGVLSQHKYGFRAKHCTIHPSIHLLNKCASSLNERPAQLTMAFPMHLM